MKIIIRLLFAAIVLLQTPPACAGELRAVVSEFETKDVDKELGFRMGIVTSEEVIRAKGFRYISPTEFVKIVTGDERLVVTRRPDLKKEFSEENRKYLEEIAKPYQKDGLDNLFKALEVTDVLVGGRLEKSGFAIKVELMMHSSKNMKDYDVEFECDERDLEKKVRGRVRELLKTISKPVKIYADKLIDEKNSMVLYMVRTMEGVDMKVEMDYTGDRPEPQCQSVRILPPEGADKSGTTTYRVKTLEGNVIDIDFGFKDGNLDYVKVDTPIPNPSDKAEQSKTLTMKSRAGYKLKFDFAWKDGAMRHAKLYPELNPFGEHD